MKDFEEQEKEEQVVQEKEVKEAYQELETKVVDVKTETGYASSEGPLEAPQWKEGTW